MSLALKVEKAPDALTDEPIGVLFIDPPEILTLLLAKFVFALTDPTRLMVSSMLPIFTVSANELSVATLIIFPPVPVAIFIVFALFPVPKLTVPVVPVSSVNALAPVVVIFPAPAKVKSVAVTPIVSSEMTPERAPRAETFRPPFDVKAKVPVALPSTIFPVPVVAIFTSEAPVVPKFVVPVDDRVVNAAVEAVVAPMAVLFMPVDVVLKLFEVIVRSFTPKSRLDAESPERFSAPVVAVRLRAPLDNVNPFDAVSSAFEVIVPVPVVAIFPLVVKFPNSLIVRVADPDD